MSLQFKTIKDLEISQDELTEWANARETSEVVALAIHAIADASRTAQDIWENPTAAEFSTVVAAVHNYVNNGLYGDEVFDWGEESFTLSDE